MIGELKNASKLLLKMKTQTSQTLSSNSLATRETSRTSGTSRTTLTVLDMILNSKQGSVAVQPTVFTMKGPPFGSGLVNEETYPGTRMNQQALTFHTQLHDWSESQQLSQQAGVHLHPTASAKPKDAYLPVRKLAHIEYWAKDVNKYYLPRHDPGVKTSQFMKIDVSKYNMKSAKSVDMRQKSASSMVKNSAQRRAMSATCKSASAMNTAQANNGSSKRHFGRSNDMNTVTNNLLETQFHYSAQRRELHSAASSSRKTGGSSGKPGADSTEKLPQHNGWTKQSNTGTTESTEICTLSVAGNSEDSLVGTTEFMADQESAVIPREIVQPVISSRSWSNRMLNVISIDDCKLTCRYRPQKIKESHEPPVDYEELDRKKHAEQKLNHQKQRMNLYHSRQNRQRNGQRGAGDGNNTGDQTATDRTDQLHGAEQVEETSDSGGQDRKSSQGSSLQESAAPAPGPADLDNRSIVSDDLEPASDEIRRVLDSRQTATSYGRITPLYSQSKQTDTDDGKKAKKKPTRAARLTTAIDGMVADRKVMNSMDRNFEVRVAGVGRTIIDKNEGSQNFQRFHSQLRRHINSMLENRSAIKSQQYYDKHLQNGSTHGLS